MTRRDPTTILEVLDHWADQSGSRQAYKFLVSGDTNGEIVSITFGELHRRARALAVHLRSRCQPKDRVILLYPPGIEYIAGLLGVMYAGAIAVPAYPPHRHSSARLLAIVEDARPVMALTTSDTLDRVKQALEEISGRRATCMASDGLETCEMLPKTSCPGEDDVAFLQYTSGSTGTPKGVRVTHGNLLHNQRMIRNAFGSGREATIAGWLPLYHDMGLVGTVLHALYLGVESVLMAPTHFMQRPFRWLEAISSFRATISGGPNSAFALCAERAASEDTSGLDLSSWAVAFNGSERVRLETMTRFGEVFAACGFRSQAFHPCYGLAEATLLVAGGRTRQASALPVRPAEELRTGAIAVSPNPVLQPVASCGGPATETEVRIVDAHTGTLMPERAIGEIWVRSPSVSTGYWSSHERLNDTFEGRLAGNSDHRYLRTGDLGFLYDGELFPTGRIKDLIVIDGVNHFPEDLERTAIESHPSLVLSGAAAFTVDDGVRERVVIALEARQRNGDLSAVIGSIRRAVASEHRVPVEAVVLIRAASLPRTSSGKIQRREARKRYLAGQLQVVAEWRAIRDMNRPAELSGALDAPPDRDAAALGGWIARRVGQTLGGVEVRTDEPLSRVGIDSLAAATITHHLEATLGVAAPVDVFFSDQTALDVAHALLSQTPAKKTPCPVSSGTGMLTPAQTSLWLLHHLSPAEDPYHIASSIRMTGALKREAARLAIESLVARHAALRSTFSEEPRQHVRARSDIDLKLMDASGWTAERLDEAMAEAIDEELDFAKGPLARFVLYKLAADEHVLLLVTHHIICDGWSMETLQHDFARFYAAGCEGTPSVPPALSITSYQEWQQERLQMPDIPDQVKFWTQQLKTFCTLPVPPGTGGRRVAVHRPVAISQAQAEHISRLTQQMGVSPFVLFASVLHAALHHVTSETDIVFGTDTANRPHAWMRSIVGMISNQLVLRGRVAPEMSFNDLVEQNRALVAEAMRHQDIPFSWVVRAVKPPRHFGQNPIFRLMFTYRNRALPVQHADGLLMFPSEVTSRRPKFDITLALTHHGNALSGFWEFDSAAVEPQWSDRLANAFDTILQRAIFTPSLPVSELLHSNEAVLA